MLLDALLAVADKEVLELTLRFIGKQQHALLLANLIISQTSGKLDNAVIAEAFGITEQAARDKAKNIVPKKGQ